MKKMILILVQILICSYVLGQAKIKPAFLTNAIAVNQSESGIRSLSLKSYLIARKEYKKQSRERLTPNFSFDLLDGSGIHLFSISKMGPIPSMNVGTRIKAGIKITI